MAALVGIALAVIVAAFAHVVGYDRDKAFYAVVLTVVASYYVLFAAMGGSKTDLLLETVIFSIFAGLAVMGFRANRWFLVVGLALHGVFDFLREWFLAGRGVPFWWPTFCMAYDVTAAAGLAMLLFIEGGRRRPPSHVK